MGKLRGFLEYERKEETTEAVELRVKNYKEFTKELDTEELNHQGARCMDCGIPFCHSGCTLGNLIPDFNHAVYQNDWKKALQILHSTNNFPELLHSSLKIQIHLSATAVCLSFFGILGMINWFYDLHKLPLFLVHLFV